jgi:hypothetical protein
MVTKKSSNKETHSLGDVVGIISDRLDNVSLSQLNDDISPLLFHNNESSSIDIPSCLPFIGPIAVVAERKGVLHGRGIITTRDVSAGECLFVIQPIFSANVNEVHTRYLLEQSNNGEGGGDHRDPAKVLERIAEDEFVKQVQAAISVLIDEEIQSKTNINRARKRLSAFLLQMSSDKVPTTIVTANPNELMETLVGNASNIDSSSVSINLSELDEKTILYIIRRNAFGPDFHSYDRIAKCWSTKSIVATNDNNVNDNNSFYYNRILGAYPLAAMINHSCCPNSVKVFSRMAAAASTTSLNGDYNSSSSSATSIDTEVMIVHANTNISKGTEITWSYLPPSTPYGVRQEGLITKYGFTCQCHRCIKEEMVHTNQPRFSNMLSTLTQIATQSPGDTEAIESVILNLEAYFVAPPTTGTPPIPTETQRFIRAGYSQYYINYINTLLQQQQSRLNDDDDDDDEKKAGKVGIDHLVQIVTNLHFAFVTCNNASTEHISILHVCYDIAVHLRTTAISTRGADSNNDDTVASCTKRVLFWTDQLKKAHMIRYGKLGEDIENVRNVMKHTKLILRNRDGWYMTRDCFI